MIYRSSLVVLLALTLTGCDGVKQIANAVIDRVSKSDAQLAAENICFSSAFHAEGERTPGLRSLNPIYDPKYFGTQVLSPTDFLVRVAYKKITLDDSADTSDNPLSVGAAVCEVKDGKLVAGHLVL